jgi:flavin reductase (DIM6/NTAB) family NADH-FMN oxidoreductase RutF
LSRCGKANKSRFSSICHPHDPGTPIEPDADDLMRVHPYLVVAMSRVQTGKQDAPPGSRESTERSTLMSQLRPATASDGAADVISLRETYGRFPSGVVALAAMRDHLPVGLAASSFTSVSISPPLVSVSIQLTSTTWPLLADRPVLGLSILSSAQDLVCRQLAAVGVNRFDGVDWVASDDGAILLRGAVGWLTCTIERSVRAGDHDLVLLRVRKVAPRAGTPLVFHASAFHRLLPFKRRWPLQPSTISEPAWADWL